MTTAEAATAGTIVDRNPATGDILARIPCSSARDVENAVENARAALPGWSALGFEGRADALERVAKRLDVESTIEKHAVLVTNEMGKPIASARAEAARGGKSIRRTIGSCRSALAPMETTEDGTTTRISREPLGVVAAITPWNFPLAMARELLIPALLAGNTVVFKPSELVPLSGQALFDEFAAELPQGVLQLVQGEEDTGKALVAADIDMVGFVGSIAAGRHIMAACSGGLKRMVLELGGKDPMIVCADADLEAAADYAVRESMRNTGQVCCAVERIYVERPVADRFTELVVAKSREVSFGPGDDDVFMGPMASQAQRDNVLAQVDDARQRGATVLLGGDAPEGPGYFMPPTVVSGVDETMDLMTQETFGPVATIRTVDDADEAVRLANASPFGLGASVWTGDNESGLALAARLESGQVGVNRGLGGAGDPPWAGAKQSGFGYLGSPDGYRQFTRPLTISWDTES